MRESKKNVSTFLKYKYLKRKLNDNEPVAAGCQIVETSRYTVVVG